MASSRQLVEAEADWGGQENYTASVNTRSSARIKSNRRHGVEAEHAALARTIEGEIIPRLMLAHRLDPAKTSRNPMMHVLPGDGDVMSLADIALHQPVDVGIAFLESLQLRGVTTETLFLDVIGPAARRLGDMWKADLCDFTDVTVGLTRLQRMLSGLTPTLDIHEDRRHATRTALLAPCPGEQHSLGLSMVQEFFRRAGWTVHPVAPQNHAELKDIVRTHSFDVVGFSIGCEIFTEHVKSAIQVTRRHSKNRAAGVMVGGPLINANPDLVAAVGADATAADGREAILRLPALLGLAARSC